MELQSLIETYLKNIPSNILYGKLSFVFYKLYIDYNRRKSGSGKKICIDFLDRIEKKL